MVASGPSRSRTASSRASQDGGVEKPTLNVMMDAEKFVEMANGDLDGRKAFLTRKLKVKGNIALAQKMQKFFPQG